MPGIWSQASRNAFSIFSALAVVIMNFVVDVLYAIIDPRIRHHK